MLTEGGLYDRSFSLRDRYDVADGVGDRVRGHLRVRPKRCPSRAALTSASVTTLAAVTTSLSMTKNERPIDAAEAGIEFQHALQPAYRPR